MVAPYRFMTIAEVRTVLRDLRRRARRTGRTSGRLNLMIFRICCCCGLRREEAAGLRLSDVILGGPKPCLRVRKEITKGKTIKRQDGTTKEIRRARLVPLWWDRGTLDDLRAWIELRRSQGAGPGDPILCGVSKVNRGKRLTGKLIASRWKFAIRALGRERVQQLSVHCGRHSFASLSLSAGRSLAEVKEALGHASIQSTNVYLHAVERERVPDVFELPATGRGQRKRVERPDGHGGDVRVDAQPASRVARAQAAPDGSRDLW